MDWDERIAYIVRRNTMRGPCYWGGFPQSFVDFLVEVAADHSLDIAGLASATSIALGMGTPQFSRAGGAELAQWRPDASTLVQASVNRRPRSASLQVRIER